MKKVLGVLGMVAVLGLTGMASAQTQELMYVKKDISHGSTLVKTEANYEVVRPKAKAVFEGIAERLRGCGDYDTKICGGRPDFIAELVAACGALQRDVIRPKRGSTDTYLVSTNYSTTEVSGVTTELPIIIGKELVGPPKEIIGSIILRCTQRGEGEGSGRPDVNSIHSVEVCHGGINGTCFNASLDANANNP